MKATPTRKPVTSWSFSAWSLYDQCPAKYAYSKLDKLPEPKSEAMERGNAIHALAEGYLKGTILKLPPELKLFEKEFKKLRANAKKRSLLNIIEEQSAFTKTWVATTWNDWTGCYVRIKVDHGYEIKGDTLIITDWKTGKFRDEDVQKYEIQLMLYAIPAFLLYPHIKKVVSRLCYLDTGAVYPSTPEDVERLTFRRADLPKLIKDWEKRVEPMFSDKIFAPRANKFCGFCHYRKANGGPCQL